METHREGMKENTEEKRNRETQKQRWRHRRRDKIGVHVLGDKQKEI